MRRKLIPVYALLIVGAVSVHFLLADTAGILERSPIELLLVRSPATTGIIIFLTMSAIALLDGFAQGVDLQDLRAVHWTRDTELLHWAEPPAFLDKGDAFGTLVYLYGYSMPLVFLAASICLLITGVGRQGAIWLAGAAALPGLHASAFAGRLWRSRRNPASVTLLNTGVIMYGNLWPWAALSWFEADRKEGIVRLHSDTPPAPVLESMRPPREMWDRALAILREHLLEGPSTHAVPRWLGLPAWVLRLSVAFLLGWAIVLGACLLPDRNLACILLLVGYWAWDKGFRHLVCKAAGIRPAKPGTGLERVEA